MKLFSNSPVICPDGAARTASVCFQSWRGEACQNCPLAEKQEIGHFRVAFVLALLALFLGLGPVWVCI